MFGLSNLIEFIKNSFSELKKMQYASKSETYLYIAIVFIMMFVSGIFFVLTDKLIAIIIAYFLK